MKGNAWLIGYLVLTAALAGGAGFFFAKGHGAYSESFTGWNRLSGKIKRLGRDEPYPNEKNAAQLEKLVTGYAATVAKLRASLVKYQKPLDDSVSDSAFTTQVLSRKVKDFLALAAQHEVEIDDTEDFYLGFEDYESTFPPEAAVPLLNYQLGAVDHLLRQLVDSGAEQIHSVEREKLAEEERVVSPASAGEGVAKAGVEAGAVVRKYPVKLKFTATHAAFRTFVNRVANDKEYFFILRLLRVDNTSPEGPNLGSTETGGPKFVNADGEEADGEVMEANGYSTLPLEEFVGAMAEKGWAIQSEDARIIFGQEKLEVFALIDLVRFPKEKGAAAKTEATARPRTGLSAE